MPDYHHYKHDMIDPKTDRVAVYERHVADLLLNNKLDDTRGNSSLLFELKHSHGAVQFGRILARKRNLPSDIVALAMLLHDIHVGLTGCYKNHAARSAEIASEMLNELGLFSDTEREQIIKIIANHSDKHITSTDPFCEIGKDADIVDCFLYPNVIAGYKFQKTPEMFDKYIERARRVYDELGIPWTGEDI